MTEKTQLILAAGGLGTRLKFPEPKALVPLAGSPILVHTLKAFQSIGLIEDAIILYPEGHEAAFAEALGAAFPNANLTLAAGGKERHDSVARGLITLSQDTAIVLIHDAARPFVQAQTIQATIDAAAQCGAATAAARCKDTILQADEEDFLGDTPERKTLWACQTPQVFRREIIEKAYASPIPMTTTDDATLVHRSGVPVRIVESSDTNLKITTPNDLQYAEFLLAKGLV